MRRSKDKRYPNSPAGRRARAADEVAGQWQLEFERTVTEVKAWFPRISRAGLSPSIQDDKLLVGGRPALKIIAGAVIVADPDAAGGVVRLVTASGGLHRAIELVLMRYRGSALLWRAQRSFPREPQRKFVRRSDGLEIMGRTGRIAVLRPTWCLLRGQSQRVEGDFLTAGAHWDRVVAVRLHQREVEAALARSRRARPRRSVVPLTGESRTITTPPTSISASLIDRCLAASADIRVRRSSDYGAHPASLRAASCRVLFQPVRLEPLSVRFDVELSGTAISGILHLRGASDPLPVALYESPPSERGDRAWAVALLGFAALTVVDAPGGPPNPRPASSIRGASRSSATSKRGRSHRLGGRFVVRAVARPGERCGRLRRWTRAQAVEGGGGRP